MPRASAFAVYSGVSNETMHMDCAARLYISSGWHLLDDANEIRRIGYVAIVQNKAWILDREDPDKDARFARC